VFNNTFDEPAHVTGGLEWLEEGTVTQDVMHAPLARALVALGPSVDGARFRTPEGDPVPEAAVLYEGGDYFHRLTLARIAVLPFFLIAIWVVWAWSRSAFGTGAAVAAVALFSTLPPVLAHAGLATTDMIFTALLGAAVLAFANWVRNPWLHNAFFFGILAALACLAKLSGLLFLPAAMIGVLVVRLIVRGERAPERAPSHSAGVLLFLLTGFVVIWGGYRFAVGPLVSPETRPHAVLDRVAGDDEEFRTTLYEAAEAGVYPAPAFWRGLNAARAKNARGHAGFLLGRRLEDHGTWTFFPAAFGVKTPLAFLLLAGAGIVLAVILAARGGGWTVLAPLAAAVCVLLVTLPSNINLGVRHVLPLYVFLAPLGGLALASLFRARILGIVIGVAALAWQVSASVLVHPDYLAYFNELAGDDPSTVLVDSDLDWGQDLYRLGAVLDSLDAGDAGLAYFGTANPDSAGLPGFRALPPGERREGWVAVSYTLLRVNPGYDWLAPYEPAATAGRSIAVYDVPPPEDTAPGTP
jgi:hypothetical protein